MDLVLGGLIMRVAEPATRGFLRIKGSKYFAVRGGCWSEILLSVWCGLAQLVAKQFEVNVSSILLLFFELHLVIELL